VKLGLFLIPNLVLDKLDIVLYLVGDFYTKLIHGVYVHSFVSLSFFVLKLFSIIDID